MHPHRTVALALLLAPTALPAAASDQEPPTPEAVTEHYVQLAHTRYVDALAGAQNLLEAVRAFLDAPSKETQDAAKAAWLSAHLTYSHTEVFRFGNPNVDAWEGKVNAWPMDEGLIDYVSDGYTFHEGNPFARLNIIVEGRMRIDDDLLAEYQSGADPKQATAGDITDVESNVTCGFHAIEFLLWGQDLEEVPGEGGQRPHTDFVLTGDATAPQPRRRRDYLLAATRLLLSDLRFMTIDWNPRGRLYSKRFAELPVEERLDRMIVGMGSLGYAEVASERIRVAMMTGDQEEEQSCFSDLSLEAIAANLESIDTTYRGVHVSRDGARLQGPSVADLVAAARPELHGRVTKALGATLEHVEGLCKQKQSLDQLIHPDNAAGKAQLAALIELLRVQTEALEEVRALAPALTEVSR